MIEILGILSTLFIVAAFICKNITYIRILDAVGALGFVVYGIVTKTWSTAALNFVLIIVNVVHLIKTKKHNKDVSIDK